MERNISETTLSICRTSIKIRLENLNYSIRQAEEQTGKVPNWMKERRNNLIDAIYELEHIY